MAASGVYGSTIKSYSTTLDGVTYIQQAFTSNAIKAFGTLTGTVSVTDSRGRTFLRPFTINVVEYEKPTVTSITYIHCDVDGNQDGSGTYTKVVMDYKVYPVEGQNTKALKLSYSKTTDESPAERLIPIDAWEGTVETIISDTDPTTTFKYVAELTDKIATSAPAVVTTGKIVMSRKAGGTGVTFFGEAEEDGLVVKGNNPLKFTDADAIVTTRQNLGINDVGGDKHYTHNQNTADLIWVITHGLGKHPSVEVVDSAGSVVIGDIEHIDLNTIKLTFTAAFSGKAFLN